ncbi:MAG: GntR family transcriptional regulator [Candidatus Hydrogenedentota bacterium]
MTFHISTGDGVPIYQQIVNQVKYLVASSKLAQGDELPPIRKLAELLVINPNTVARAYRDLEREGVVECKRGGGTHVTARRSPLSQHEQERVLNDRADALLSEARQLNVPFNELLDLLRKRNREMKVDAEEKE